MLDKLQVINFSPDCQSENVCGQECFVLQTCQRVLLIGFASQIDAIKSIDFKYCEIYRSDEAYNFLLQVICGLRSNILAEGEIVRQFKKAYENYKVKENRNTKLMRIIERVFKDAKEIRTQHLHDLNGTSYASLSRKIVNSKGNFKDLLLLGSGDLSHDIIKLFQKRFNLHISARNPETLIKLASQKGLQVVSWKDYDAWRKFDCIINTIGAPITLLDQNFFERWRLQHEKKKVFIDLGYPSILDTSLGTEENLYRLDNIMKISQDSSKQNIPAVEKARFEIDNLSEERKEFFYNFENKKGSHLSDGESHV